MGDHTVRGKEDVDGNSTFKFDVTYGKMEFFLVMNNAYSTLSVHC